MVIKGKTLVGVVARREIVFGHVRATPTTGRKNA